MFHQKDFATSPRTVHVFIFMSFIKEMCKCLRISSCPFQQSVINCGYGEPWYLGINCGCKNSVVVDFMRAFYRPIDLDERLATSTLPLFFLNTHATSVRQLLHYSYGPSFWRELPRAWALSYSCVVNIYSSLYFDRPAMVTLSAIELSFPCDKEHKSQVVVPFAIQSPWKPHQLAKKDTV